HWVAKHVPINRKPTGDDGMRFFIYLQNEQRDVLDLSTKGLDPWSIIHGWLIQHQFNFSPKMEIVGALAVRNGFSRYLEICTSSTGGAYGLLDRKILTTAHRLLYNCQADFEDGL